MTVEDLEREIIKVTQQGGLARVSEETILEAMECEEEDRRAGIFCLRGWRSNSGDVLFQQQAQGGGEIEATVDADRQEQRPGMLVGEAEDQAEEPELDG